MNQQQEQKTPWNPSRKALARVKNPLPAPTHCPKCLGPVRIANNSEVYGREYGEWPWLYICERGRACDVYVGMHPFTNIPLGTLADKETRDLRNSVKKPFNQLWQDGGPLTREQAYAALAARMGIPVERCHFGWFDAGQCRTARACIIKIWESLK